MAGSLVDRADAGDPAAAAALLAQHLTGLHAFIRLRMGPPLRRREDSGDLVQSVCAEILGNLSRYQHPGERQFRQWLFRTAERKIADHWKHQRRLKRDPAREVRLADSEGGHDLQLLAQYRSFCSPSGRVAAREELERAEAGFDKLAEDEREVILLANVVGLSRAEIATQLGKSEGAVRTMLSRALSHLAELVDEPSGGAG
ncbi:MAG: sigma-70 family RNA polymerase sigma factor [Planctomycetota bacterium]|nr:MAG: sigma-70 family RNA polymerase sigma factor [Planctomycetota bacterium]